MKALVTGATGFVGRRLLEQLDQPIVLSRDASRAKRQLAEFDVTAFSWQPTEEMPPAEAFDGVDVIFHLAGDPVAEGRWNAAKKKRIEESRIVGTRNLVQRLSELENRPRVLVSASAVGYYGSRGDETLDESASHGSGFLSDVCIGWEREAQRAAELGVRVVSVRVGIVLGKGGGALGRMLLPFKLGLGGRLGNGKHWMPWVHLDDLVGLLLHAAETEEVSGPMNGVAPNSVTNRDFTSALAVAVHRPALFPAPKFALRAAFGEFANDLFASQRVVPRVALDSGYEFQFPEINGALQKIVRS